MSSSEFGDVFVAEGIAAGIGLVIAGLVLLTRWFYRRGNNSSAKSKGLSTPATSPYGHTAFSSQRIFNNP